jgi:acetyl esterase/lipase
MRLLPRRLDVINKIFNAAGLRVTRHIPFGLHPRQKMDIYNPPARGSARLRSETADEPLPVIVFFYGGIWQFGDRADYEFIASTLARKGFVVVVPDCRLYPDVKFPRFLDDNATVTAWVLKNISEFGGDNNAVFLMGHSSGAYNVAMLALDASQLENAGADSKRIAGVIGLAGAYEFDEFRYPNIAEIFTGPDVTVMYEPGHYVRQSAPPMLLVHGGKDVLISPHHTVSLAARIREAGGNVETRIYPRLGHIGMILACLPIFSWRGPFLNDLMNFVAACRNGEFVEAGSKIAAPV